MEGFRVYGFGVQDLGFGVGVLGACGHLGGCRGTCFPNSRSRTREGSRRF